MVPLGPLAKGGAIRDRPPQPQPMTVPQALRDHCNLHPTAFALIYVDASGQLHLHSSPSLAPRRTDIFTRQVWQVFLDAVAQRTDGQTGRTAIRGVAGGASVKVEHGGDSHGSWEAIARPVAAGQEPLQQPRSRIPSLPLYVDRRSAAHPSASVTPSTEEDDGSPENSADEGQHGGSRTQFSFEIGNENHLNRYYRAMLLQMQQIPCKSLSKGWIKVVQPKKQSTNPYNGGRHARECGQDGNGDLTRPEWWPADCPHTEPDHIKKEPRLNLLLHILRGLRGTRWERTVDQLRESTDKLFQDGQPRAEECQAALDDIYTMKGYEDRFYNGEIDSSYTVNVLMPQESRSTPRRLKRKSYGAPARRQQHPSKKAKRRSTDAADPSLPLAPPSVQPGHGTAARPEEGRALETAVPPRRRMGYWPTEPGAPERSVLSPPDSPATVHQRRLDLTRLELAYLANLPDPTNVVSTPRLREASARCAGTVGPGLPPRSYHHDARNIAPWYGLSDVQSVPPPPPLPTEAAWAYDPAQRLLPANPHQMVRAPGQLSSSAVRDDGLAAGAMVPHMAPASQLTNQAAVFNGPPTMHGLSDMNGLQDASGMASQVFGQAYPDYSSQRYGECNRLSHYIK